MNGDDLHQFLEVLVDHLFLGVLRLRKATQKHRRRSDVLASPSELWGIVSSIHDVVLDLAGATSSAACRVTRAWRLALPPLSQLFAVLLCTSEGLRMRVRRGVSL